MLSPRTVFRRYNTDGVPDSGKHDPDKAEIIQLLERIQQNGGAVVSRATKAQLLTYVPTADTFPRGEVLDDPTPELNGWYVWDGAWVRERSFPDTLSRLTITGGTNNVLWVNSTPGVDPGVVTAFFIDVETVNSGDVTLRINGAAAIPAYTINGEQFAAGEFTGRIFLSNDGDSLKALNDAAASSSAAASAAAANASRIAAEAAAAGAGVTDGDKGDVVVSSDGMEWSVRRSDKPLAEAGIDNDHFMTPLSTRQAIAALLGIEPAINRWKASRAAARVLYGGLAQPAASGSAGGGTSGTGRTFALDTVSRRIRQDGFIRTVKISLSAAGIVDLTGAIRFKVLRKSGSVYTLVSQSELITLSAVTTLQTCNLATPMACQPGDVVAVWIKGFASNAPAIRSGASSGDTTRFISGETLSGAWTDIADTGIDLQFEGTPPFIIALGDSILEGHNTATPWHGQYHQGPAGEPTSEPMNQVRSRIPSLEYQNFGVGSTGWADVLSKVGAVNAVAPMAVVVATGINDIAVSRSWSAIKADMDAFRAALSPNTSMFVSEVLPWTAGSDALAGDLRVLNTHYATWCAENGATLILAHNAMGEARPSTGQLDNLLSTFNYDGVHLTTAGVDALGGLITDGLHSVLWLG